LFTCSHVRSSFLLGCCLSRYVYFHFVAWITTFSHVLFSPRTSRTHGCRFTHLRLGLVLPRCSSRLSLFTFHFLLTRCARILGFRLLPAVTRLRFHTRFTAFALWDRTLLGFTFTRLRTRFSRFGTLCSFGLHTAALFVLLTTISSFCGWLVGFALFVLTRLRFLTRCAAFARSPFRFLLHGRRTRLGSCSFAFGFTFRTFSLVLRISYLTTFVVVCGLPFSLTFTCLSGSHFVAVLFYTRFAGWLHHVTLPLAHWAYVRFLHFASDAVLHLVLARFLHFRVYTHSHLPFALASRCRFDCTPRWVSHTRVCWVIPLHTRHTCLSLVGFLLVYGSFYLALHRRFTVLTHLCLHYTHPHVTFTTHTPYTVTHVATLHTASPHTLHRTVPGYTPPIFIHTPLRVPCLTTLSHVAVLYVRSTPRVRYALLYIVWFCSFCVRWFVWFMRAFSSRTALVYSRCARVPRVYAHCVCYAHYRFASCVLRLRYTRTLHAILRSRCVLHFTGCWFRCVPAFAFTHIPASRSSVAHTRTHVPRSFTRTGSRFVWFVTGLRLPCVRLRLDLLLPLRTCLSFSACLVCRLYHRSSHLTCRTLLVAWLPATVCRSPAFTVCYSFSCGLV